MKRKTRLVLGKDVRVVKMKEVCGIPFIIGKMQVLIGASHVEM